MVTFRAMNLDTGTVPLLTAARKRGFGTTDFREITLAGATHEELLCADFKSIRQLDSPLRLLPLSAQMEQEAPGERASCSEEIIAPMRF